jgi:TonB family protein
LSGPDELRKTVLQSVLGWHFTPQSASSTKVVNVQFQTPSNSEPRPQGSGPAPSSDNRSAQLVSTTEFLKAEIERLQAQLRGGVINESEFLRDQQAQIEQNRDAIRAKEAEMQARMAELRAVQQKLAAAEAATRAEKGQVEQNPDVLKAQLDMVKREKELRALEEKLVAAQTATRLGKAQFALEGRTLRSIRLVGLGISLEDFLAQSQLPLRAGDTLTQNSIEAATTAISKFDEHLSVGWVPAESNSVDLTIIAPGARIPGGRGGRGGAAPPEPPQPPQPAQLPEPAQAPQPPQPAQAPQAGAYRIGDGVSAPVPIYQPQPDYTEQAKSAQWQGTVGLSLVVDDTGKPVSIKVTKSLGMGLDEKAVEAIQKWKFKPGTKDGQPVPVQANIEVNFRLL